MPRRPSQPLPKDQARREHEHAQPPREPPARPKTDDPARDKTKIEDGMLQPLPAAD